MTTIAWDGKTLAADRMGVYGATKRLVCKIFDCGEFAYGGSGDFAVTHQVSEWLAAGASQSERITLSEGISVGIAVRKSDGTAYVVEGVQLVLTGIRDKFFATGSGHEYARAAMAMGKTAAQAIAFASRFDVYTGMGVDTWRLPRKR